MAVMIPQTLSDWATPAERRVFDEFQNSDLAENWVILHSVKIPGTRRRQRPSEVDFVVLIPDSGAICLEVKGGFYSADDVQAYAEEGMDSPRVLALMQAQRYLHAVKAYLDRQSLRDIPVGCAVAFTETEWADQVHDEPLSSPIYDRRTLAETGELCAALAKYAQELEGNPPTREDMDQVRRRLVPGSDLHYAWGAKQSNGGNIDAQLMRLTEEQYHNLELAEYNDRCLIEGGAGTGKTMLALELARRQTEKGDRVLFLCSTVRQMNWLRALAPREVEIQSRETFLASLIDSDLSATESGGSPPFERYFAEYTRLFSDVDTVIMDDDIDLRIRYALEATERSARRPFDYLIVDEVQNFTQQQYWQILDSWLIGGLVDGKWAMFGHFFQNPDHLGQEIDSGQRIPDTREILRGLGSYWSRGVLKVNCRNTEPIAETARRFALDPLGSRVLASEVPGRAVDCVTFRTTTELEMRLDDAIVDLSKSYRREQIVVLALNDLNQLGAHGFNTRRRYGQWQMEETLATPHPLEHSLEYVRIMNFQGMEREAVVFIAIPGPAMLELRQDDFSLMYLSLSRAKERLIILADTDLPNFIKERLPWPATESDI